MSFLKRDKSRTSLRFYMSPAAGQLDAVETTMSDNSTRGESSGEKSEGEGVDARPNVGVNQSRKNTNKSNNKNSNKNRTMSNKSGAASNSNHSNRSNHSNNSNNSNYRVESHIHSPSENFCEQGDYFGANHSAEGNLGEGNLSEGKFGEQKWSDNASDNPRDNASDKSHEKPHEKSGEKPHRFPSQARPALPQAPDFDSLSPLSPVLRDNYRGFHRLGVYANVPPLAAPIKPLFRKRGLGLLGKLMHPAREDTRPKHKFRLPLISQHHALRNLSWLDESDRRLLVPLLRASATGAGAAAAGANGTEATSSPSSGYTSPPSGVGAGGAGSGTGFGSASGSGAANPPAAPSSGFAPLERRSTMFDLDLLAADLLSIVKTKSPASRPTVSATNSTNSVDDDRHAWKAPDSWDVTEVVQSRLPEKSDDIPAAQAEQRRGLDDVSTPLKAASFSARPFPALFGRVASQMLSEPGPNHIIRVFKEDNTFTTILCPVDTTTSELLQIVQRKFFLESTSNYRLSVLVANNTKVLEPFERPLRIQLGLLSLSGYSERENLRVLGREDMSFVCKFVVENNFLRNLTHEEESLLSKDYVNVDISSLKLKTIPIIFHQHTYEIETLNVSDNPDIHIPLDFIQSCSNLSSISFARNGCSKFPSNFLEAPNLVSLDISSNFLDEIPMRFSVLQNLQNLKLNSNQLFELPESFGELKNLVSLNLSSNCFLVYPECLNGLVNLQDLDLSYNDLASIPPSICKLSKLTKLNLCTNKLDKKLPDCFKTLAVLKRLDIRYNRITNIDVLGSLPTLEVLYASKNNIAAFSDKMESLRLLHFDRNPITSLEFEIMLDHLTVLDLSKAKITAIPGEFVSKMPHVEKLVLDKNHLVTLPDELSHLPRLTYLSLYHNNLQKLPESIGNLCSLQYLDLHGNNIETLPDSIWNLKSLSILNVSSNMLSSFPKPDQELTTKMATEKGGHSSLATSLLSLVLADNRLNDDCYEPISLLIHLKQLNISYNDLMEIPDGALKRLTKLTELFLSGNNFVKLPVEDIENLTDLKLLYLNNNKLNSLPSELGKLKNLMHFDVGSNELRYNVSNWPYDWNWCWNKKLKYLNFSGNKRFEIKQSHIKNPDTGEDFDSLLVLDDLKVLGLIDVTLTTPSVPDQTMNKRVRTTASELDNVGYGVSDTMGIRENISSRDIFIQKFRGNEDEVLLCSFDGKSPKNQPNGHLISYLAKHMFVPNFTSELSKVKSDEGVQDAMRRAFLSLNKEINSAFAAKRGGYFTSHPVFPDLAKISLTEDGLDGASMSVVYLKGNTLYCGNVGDIEVVMTQSNGNYQLLSTKHDPTSRQEFERIRPSGGYVSGDGALDGTLKLSRGVGFFDYIPHTNANPSLTSVKLSGTDDIIIVGSTVFWDFVTYDLAVDIVRQEKNNLMIAAEKLRDYAICYGATDKITVTVISIGDQRKQKIESMYKNLGRDVEFFGKKKRRYRATPAGDTALRRLDSEIDPPVGELALVFTDIKNSTLLWDAYPVAMRSAIKLHNTIMRRQLRIVGGYEVKTEGDSFMVSFPSPTSALLWCFNVQNQLLVEDWPTEILETNECCEVTDNSGNIIFRGLSVRMGIHWGSPVCELDMVTRRMDYFGPMVNRTSRIESSADGGQIAMSSDFLRKLKKLNQIHEQIQNGELTLEEAYEGNVRAGQIIEKELAALDERGYSFFELGERKLKGLETPEMITLGFSKNLEIRYEIFKKKSNRDIEYPTRIFGALPVESVYRLRTISLRLENISSVLCSGVDNDEKFLKSSSEVIFEKIGSVFVEQDTVGLLNHIVTRIENCVATVELRQSLQHFRGDPYFDRRSVWALMDEVKELLSQMKQQKQ